MIIRRKAVASRYFNGFSCVANDTAYVSVSVNRTAVIAVRDASPFCISDDTACVFTFAFDITGVPAFDDGNSIAVSNDAPQGRF